MLLENPNAFPLTLYQNRSLTVGDYTASFNLNVVLKASWQLSIAYKNILPLPLLLAPNNISVFSVQFYFLNFNKSAKENGVKNVF